jgi:AraC family transcriptional regulator, regulatory protein of adaptative response / methylated-DNA-[protein]-cysteine methyltransferase
MKNKEETSQKTLTASRLQTPLGAMLAISDNQYLYLLKFIDQDNVDKSIKSLQESTASTIIDGKTPISMLLATELDQYFQGALHQFTVPINPIGTIFQKKSWQALLQIPYGATTNYGKQAIVVGNPKAFRAVANANKHNPIAIIIPCHRIIKSNGDLCGYNGGVHRKQALLEVEKSNFKSI